MLELSGVFMPMMLVVFAGDGLFAASIRHHIISPARADLDGPHIRGGVRRAGAGLAFVRR